MEGDDIVKDGSEFVGDTHSTSQILELFDSPPIFDSTLIFLWLRYIEMILRLKSMSKL